MNQSTVASELIFSGTSVHTGKEVKLVVKPADPSTGIIFKRVDLPGDNIIKASYDYVVDTNMCTAIANSAGAKVMTIEHLMAAFWGCGIDNAIIEIDSDEVPIMDGSSEVFVRGIRKVGLKEQHADKVVINLPHSITVRSGDKLILMEPDDHFSISCQIDIPHHAIGEQDFMFDSRIDRFEDIVAPARTFGFKKDLERLQNLGLALGASLDNTIGIDDAGVMNEDGLRYDNEFARHKVLDCIGDFALSGATINAKITAYKPAHNINNKAVHELFAALKSE